MVRFLLVVLIALGGAYSPASGQHRPAEASELRASRLLVRGMTMLQAGDAASARASLEMALHLSPNNPSVLAALADAYAAAGDLTEALHYGAHALTANPADPENALKLARRYATDNNVNAGVDALERHLRAAPDLSAHLLLIRFLNDHGRITDALGVATDTFHAFGPEGMLIEAVLDASSSEATADARESLLTDLVRASSDPVVALSVIDDRRLDASAASRMREHLRAAFPALDRVTAGTSAEVVPPATEPNESGHDPALLYRHAVAHPRDVDAAVRAAHVLQRAGRSGLAYQIARDASSFFPGRDDLSSLRIRAAVSLGDRAGAMAASRAALRFDSSVDLAYAAAAWSADEDSDLGAEGFEFIESVTPDDDVARLIAALALAERGSPERQIARLMLGVDGRARDSSELSGLRGLVEHARGQANVAREWLEHSVELGGAFPLAIEALAGLYESTGEGALARELRDLARDRRATTL
jgi:tetratricopeptide (TPR) repeat protein